jgi:hypothetical protein
MVIYPQPSFVAVVWLDLTVILPPSFLRRRFEVSYVVSIAALVICFISSLGTREYSWEELRRLSVKGSQPLAILVDFPIAVSRCHMSSQVILAYSLAQKEIKITSTRS